MGFYFAQLLTGLANASSLFLIASGLSIIFGVTRVVNFAHGSLYMIGAYVAYTLITRIGGSIPGFWLCVLLAAGAVAILGGILEILVLRRIYQSPELFQLVATFGLVLLIQDAAHATWGAQELLGPRAPGLNGTARIFGENIPHYDLALIFIGPTVFAAIWLIFHRTRWGVLVRAATQDREMVGALGVNQAALFTATFMLGSFLAGLGGALQVPRDSVNLHMDLNVIADVFVVVVIGGMGSVTGAFVAAIIISVANAFGILVYPQIPLVLPFLVMALVLIVRPHGLFGTPASAHGAPTAPEAPLRPLDRRAIVAVTGLLLAAMLVPLLKDEFLVVLLIEILIAILFAASLHLIMGLGGMASFGHAAYFGLSAYAAAIAVKQLGFGMLAAMLVAPFVSAIAALVFGWFFVRLSGVYLAMLTLAAAQIIWGVVFQWKSVSGGDDGIRGIWPTGWAAEKTVYYFLTLAVVVAGLWLIRRIAFSPFGYALRGGRDSSLRAESIGVDLRRVQWLAFTLSGALAGAAGVLFVFSKGSVFPDTLGIPMSVDALIMVLLGGVQSLWGPISGAAAFVAIKALITRLDYWRFLFGIIILLIAIAAPDGIAGGIRRLLERMRRPGEEAARA
ncbi:MAG: ABC transporter permease [Hyphomicrobiaceae bacterium]|nr:MAG: ABC transporter permease [Hyphomicrobiaceae bacterium]